MHASPPSIASGPSGVERTPISQANLALLVHDRELELVRCSGRPSPRRRRSGQGARAAQGDELGPHARRRVPRLLPRLPRAFRRGPARAHPGSAVARRRGPGRSTRSLSTCSGCTLLGDVNGAESHSGAPPPEVPPSPSEGPILRDLLPDTSAVTADGHLSVGGVDLLQIAEEVGTPVFVYDEHQMRRRAARRRGLRRRRRLRDEGVPVQGDGRARPRGEDGTRRLDRRRDGGRAGAAVPSGEPRDARQQQIREELEDALRAGVCRIVVD